LAPSVELILGGKLAVLQSPMLDGLSFDPFALLDDGLRPAQVGIAGHKNLKTPSAPAC
jgi:hypothetical protein